MLSASLRHGNDHRDPHGACWGHREDALTAALTGTHSGPLRFTQCAYAWPTTAVPLDGGRPRALPAWAGRAAGGDGVTPSHSITRRQSGAGDEPVKPGVRGRRRPLATSPSTTQRADGGPPRPSRTARRAATWHGRAAAMTSSISSASVLLDPGGAARAAGTRTRCSWTGLSGSREYWREYLVLRQDRPPGAERVRSPDAEPSSSRICTRHGCARQGMRGRRRGWRGGGVGHRVASGTGYPRGRCCCS